MCLRDREEEEIRKGGREKRKGKSQRMTQLVKCSGCKHKDVSSNPSTHLKIQAQGFMSVTLALGRAVTGDTLELTGQSSNVRDPVSIINK